MNSKLKKTFLARSTACASAIVGVFLAQNVLADDYRPSGYIGAGYGRISVNDSDFKDNDESGKVYLGGKFGRYVGIEASANDFGKSSREVARWKLKGKTLALVGFLPFNDNFSLFAKAGNLWWDADTSILGVKKDFDGNEGFGGVGAQFNITPMFSVRAEYERYLVKLDKDEVGVDVDSDSKVNVASLGAQLNF